MASDFRSFRARFTSSTPVEKVLDEWQAYQRRGDQVRWMQSVVAAGEGGSTAVRRGPGRPAWSEDKFFRRYREATERLDADATDKEIAADFHVTPDHLRRLVRRFGRPPER